MINKICDMISRAEKEPIIIAIEGNAAAGKTTLAEKLALHLLCDIVHTDDFFLPTSLRTPERLSQAGGNIHYERFLDEVIAPVTAGRDFEYRLFDCSKMDYCQRRQIRIKNTLIVEGSYSLHPKFGNYANIKIFCEVPADEQLRRIISRNGEEKAKLFAERWIPMEEKYFSTFKIKEACDVILNTK